MTRTQFLLNRIFAAIFFLCFLWIFCVFFYWGSYYQQIPDAIIRLNNFIIILGAMAVTLFLFVLLKLSNGLHHSNVRFSEPVIVFFAFLLYFILQLFFAHELRCYTGYFSDINIVADNAAKYVFFGEKADGWYFRLFPNNIPLLLLEIGIFKIFAALGYEHFINAGIAANIITINISILLVYLTVKKIKNSRTAAMISLIVMMLTLPLLSYVATYYTDTLTIMYPILSLYLWTCAKQNLKADKNKKAFIQIGFCVISIVIGSLIKIFVAIVFIAIIADALISFKIKKSTIIVMLVIALFSVTYFPCLNAILNTPVISEENADTSPMPVKYFLLLGLKGKGHVNAQDSQIIFISPEQEREKYIEAEMTRVMEEYGFFGLLDHLSEKNAYVWADGTYSSSIFTVEFGRVAPSSLDAYIYFMGDQFLIYAYYCQFFMLVMITGFLLCAWYLFRNKEFASIYLPFALSVFGLFLLELFWEASQRYLINFIPVFVVLTVCCYEKLYRSVAALFKKRFKCLELLRQKLRALVVWRNKKS